MNKKNNKRNLSHLKKIEPTFILEWQLYIENPKLPIKVKTCAGAVTRLTIVFYSLQLWKSQTITLTTETWT